jgi:hypothetical protein
MVKAQIYQKEAMKVFRLEVKQLTNILVTVLEG